MDCKQSLVADRSAVNNGDGLRILTTRITKEYKSLTPLSSSWVNNALNFLFISKIGWIIKKSYKYVLLQPFNYDFDKLRRGEANHYIG